MLGQLRRAVEELERTATESSSTPTTAPGVTPVQVVVPAFDFGGVSGIGSGAMAAVSQAVMMLFLVYFLLAWGETFKRKFVRLSGDRLSKRRVTLETIDQIVERMARSLSHMAMTASSSA